MDALQELEMYGVLIALSCLLIAIFTGMGVRK